MVPGSLCWIAIPCSSWIFMSLDYTAISFQFQQIPVPASDISQFRSRGSSHRSWLRASGLGAPIVVKLQLHFHMSGNTAYIAMQMANRMARRIAYLWLVKIKVSNILHPLILCMKKGTGSFGSRLFKPEFKDMRRIVYLKKRNVRWIIENPSTSLLWRYKSIRATCQQTGKQITVRQCPTTMCFLMTYVYTRGSNQEPDRKVWCCQSGPSLGRIWSLYCKTSPLPVLSSGCEID